MPLQATSGAASYDAFGGGVAAVPNYIEEVFGTFLYTGNGSTQTITNGIDLSTKGGMVWSKVRDNSFSNALQDTVRGPSNILFSNSNVGNQAYSTSITSFGTTGYTLGNETLTNQNTGTFVGWTFREQPKFFDVVTYTGNGVAGRNIPHALNSVPGFVIVKRTDTTGEWRVLHRNDGTNWLTGRLISSALDTSPSPVTFGNDVVFIAPTSTQFTVGSFADVNESGGTYVAYVFAHNAGGFGLTGTDNVISCGSYTGNGSTTGPLIDIGYEPQFLLVKNASGVSSWSMWDSMRGITTDGTAQNLTANSANAETTSSSVMAINATGFQPKTTSSLANGSGSTYIYIAIRRGPMKVPTDATKVFAPVKITATPTTTVTTNFPVDSVWNAEPNAVDSGYKYVFDRLRGGSTSQYNYLITSLTNPEAVGGTSGLGFDSNVSVVDKYWGTAQGATSPIIYWNFRRAPSFFDEVCYTGTGSATTVTHNLGVAPELMIIKSRSGASNWAVYSQATGNTNYLLLNTTDASAASSAYWNNTTPTSTVFSLNNAGNVNANTYTYVAYLFATCLGVSKVGSYTGTATTQQINCGFTAGARFVLIKRTDSTGDWYVWDSARGIVAGNDPYLLLNSTAAEVTSTDYVDTYSAGFEISSTAPSAINASGGTFIFLAIA